MKLTKIAFFLFANFIGFASVGICYAIGLSTGMFENMGDNFDARHFKTWFLAGTLLTWLVCALFSLSYFFFKGKIRFLFLWIPAVIPLAYGLSVLYGVFSI